MDKLIALLKEFGGAIVETRLLDAGEKDQARISGRISDDLNWVWLPNIVLPTTAEQIYLYQKWYPATQGTTFPVEKLLNGELNLQAQFKNPRDLLHTSPVFKAIYMGILHNKTSPFHIIEDLIREQMNLHEKIRELNYAVDRYRLPVASPTTDKLEEEQ